MLWTIVAIVAVLIVLAVTLVVLRFDGNDGDGRPSFGDGLTPADVQRNTPITQPPPLVDGPDLAAWVDGTAKRTGIPARVVAAYAAAEIAQRAATPRCGLSWVTIAAIGRVESVHGQLRGGRIDADGVARPVIIGLPLDGTNGTRETPDTDGGALDRDTTYDRAVGPMQFLPATWARYGGDGNGDGVRDPNQIDDATRGAAAYLCSGRRDMVNGTGWWDGVMAYNRSTSYAQLVWAAAQRYGGVG